MNTSNAPAANPSKLVALEKLICDTCKRYLNVPPIMVFINGTSICGRCYNPANYENAAGNEKPTHNTAFEHLVQILPFPCINRDNGCPVKSVTELYPIHEAVCRFRSFNCPARSCTWSGFINNLRTHYENDHADDIITTSVINMNTSDDHVGHLFILQDDLELLFQYKFNTSTEKYYCDIYFVTNPREKMLYFMELTFEKETDGSSISLKKQISNTLDSIEQNTALEMDVPAMKALLNTTCLQAKIKVSGAMVTLNTEDTKLLNELKCPVCMHLFVPPIFLCGNGHSVCQSCKRQLTTCPICRIKYQNVVHNFTLEKLVIEITYPCKYMYAGCAHTALATEIMDHESTCHYATL